MTHTVELVIWIMHIVNNHVNNVFPRLRKFLKNDVW